MDKPVRVIGEFNVAVNLGIFRRPAIGLNKFLLDGQCGGVSVVVFNFHCAGGDLVARNHEPYRLTDTLVIGAFIEARSCERFAMLVPHLDEELGDFYRSLLKSEARHYQDYLRLAKNYAGEPIDEHIARFAAVERDAIFADDADFRFHSGVAA